MEMNHVRSLMDHLEEDERKDRPGMAYRAGMQSHSIRLTGPLHDVNQRFPLIHDGRQVANVIDYSPADVPIFPTASIWKSHVGVLSMYLEK